MNSPLNQKLSRAQIVAATDAGQKAGSATTFLEAEDFRHDIGRILAGRLADDVTCLTVLEYSIVGPLSEEAAVVAVKFALAEHPKAA